MKPINDQAAEAAAGEQPQGQPVPEGERESVGPGDPLSEEEQLAYDKVIIAAGEILFGDGSHEQIMKMLQNGAQNPEQALSKLAVTMVTQLDEASGGTIPEEIILLPVAEIIEQAAELATAAGLFQADEAMMNRAAQMALVELGAMYGVEEAEIREMLESFSEEDRNALAAEQRKYAGMPEEQAAPAGAPAPQQAPAGAV